MGMPRESDDDKIIEDYSAMLSDPPKGYIHDTSLLPHPKKRILEELLLRIATVGDPGYVNSAGICALALSNYQDGVGESIHAPIAASSGELVGYDFERFRHFSELSLAEAKETMKLIETMNEINPINRKNERPPSNGASKKSGWRRFLGL